MSSAGINPLAIYDPQLFVQQQAIQRQQALANALLQAPQEQGRFGGLAGAGRNILGAILAKRGDKAMADLYGGAMGQQAPQQPQAAPPPSNGAPPNQMAQAGFTQSQPAPPQQQGGAPMPQMGNMSEPKPADYGSLNPYMQRLYDSIPHIPGISAQQTVMGYISDPKTYMTAAYQAQMPTPEQKNAQFAMPGDPRAQQTAISGILGKSGTITGRAGNALIGPNGQTTYVPPQAPPGYTYIQGQDGRPYMVQIGGGLPAVAGSNYASTYGKQSGTGAVGYDANSQPVGTNQAALYGLQPPGGPMIPGVDPGATQAIESRGNPNAVSPAGAVGPMQTMPGTLQQPGFGVQPAQNGTAGEQARVGADYQQAMMQRYKNPVLAAVAYNWGPGNTDKWLAAGGDFSKLPAETQMYLGRMAVAQAIPQQGSQNPPQPTLRPELPQGQATYMQGQAKDAADRHDQTVAAAAESPMRINVLDNIINLSGQGVATGPGQDWQNTVLGYAANTPILSKLMGGAKDNVAKFQELQKFTYQNALRNWTAAGGTGTDAQMVAASHANPNDHLFPQALMGIAKWAKASELAIQGKANAQDRYLAANGQTPPNQIGFENQWRNAFDPKAFQYQLMSPQEKQAFAASLSPMQAKQLVEKTNQLKQLGALQ